MCKNVLEPFEPFNSIWYMKCHYHALFPILTHLGGDIRSFLINNVYSYEYINDEKVLKLICQSSKEENEILLEQGIHFDKMLVSENIIGSLTEAIDRKMPVIVGTDCYYLKDRDSEYKKIHLPHDLLVYGYNMRDECFYVIEHNHRESYKFFNTAIDYSVIKEAYMGYVHIMPYETQPTYLTYTSKFKPQKQSDEYYKQAYAKLFIEKQVSILKGLFDIIEFGRQLDQMVERSIISQELEIFINCLNVICNIKNVEKYSLQYIFGDYINITMIETVISNWRFIRNIFVKYNYSSQIKKTSLENIIKRLQQLYEEEKFFYEQLFNQMSVI